MPDKRGVYSFTENAPTGARSLSYFRRLTVEAAGLRSLGDLSALRDRSSIEIGLNEFRTRVNINLTQRRVARINKAMRCVRGNDGDVTRFCLARFVSDCNGGAAFKGKCDLHVGMRV